MHSSINIISSLNIVISSFSIIIIVISLTVIIIGISIIAALWPLFDFNAGNLYFLLLFDTVVSCLKTDENIQTKLSYLYLLFLVEIRI